MTIRLGPTGTGHGGENMTDADWAEMAKAMLGTGVIAGANIGGSPGQDLVVSTGAALSVNVGTGQGMVYGLWAQNDAAVNVVLSAADPSLPRIDTIILKKDASANPAISITKKTGTPAGSPVQPSLTQTSTVWEEPLCNVAVAAAATSLTGGNLTDRRRFASTTIANGSITDALVGSRTINDGVAIGSTDTDTYGNFLNKFGALFRAITGSADWFTAPAQTIASLITSIAGKVSKSGDTMSGNLAITGNLSATGTVKRGANELWGPDNDGTGSGLDADTVDGVQAAGILQFGSGGQKTGFKVTEGSTLPVSGMVKGDVHYLTPFALP
jgi:hypothetical protein